MRAVMVDSFVNARLDVSGFAPEAANLLLAEFIAMARVFAAHVRRIDRHGAGSDFGPDTARVGRGVRDWHRPPLPVDGLLVGLSEVLALTDLEPAQAVLLDRRAYVAGWRFATGTGADLGALGVFTARPGPRMVLYWRGLRAEQERRLARYAAFPGEIAAEVRRAQALPLKRRP